MKDETVSVGEAAYWNVVDVIETCPDFEDLLEQVERDEADLFWR